MVWDDSRIASLRTLFVDERKTPRQISNIFGDKTPGAVSGMAWRQGLYNDRPAIESKGRHTPEPPQRSFRECQWPIGNPGDPDFRSCGAEVKGGKPYCEDHCALAYRGKDNDEVEQKPPDRSLRKFGNY
jgi:GcrA cell cycle regulator